MRATWIALVGLAACAAKQRPSPHAHRSTDLILLFDQARFGRNDAALSQLWLQLQLPGKPTRGLEATNRVLSALGARLHDEEARALLRADRLLLGASNLREAAVPLRRILDAQSELATSAALRLHSVCFEAFRRAIAVAGTAAKARKVNECLFGIQDGDPTPYFESNPAKRPPDPPWTALAARAKVLLNSTPRNHPLAAIAQRRSDELEGLLAREGSKLPAPVDVTSLDLPVVDGGLPYDRSPLLQVGVTHLKVDGLSLDSSADKTLAAVLAEDQSQRVAVVAPSSLPWWEVQNALKTARRAGSLVAELAVVESLRAEIPAGDFYAGSKDLKRLAVFPVSIATLAPSQSTLAPPRDLPRGLVFDTRAIGAPKVIIATTGVELRGLTPSGTGQTDPFLALKAHRSLAGIRVSIYPDVSYGKAVEHIARLFSIVSAIAIEPLTP